jgi:hypothetical protein
MPIIVDELVITVEVGPAGQAAASGGAADGVDDKQALVAEVVEQVLEILRQREEP